MALKSPQKPVPLPRDLVPLPTFLNGTRYRLWLEGDTLIYHEIAPYSESCKRFALVDIQALVMSRTRRQAVITVALLVAGVACILPGRWIYDQASPTAGLVTLGVLWGILGFFLLLNVAFGPTCTLDLHTAVQRQRLPTCGRLRTARRLIARLIPEIGRHEAAREAIERPAGVETAPETESRETVR